MATEVLVHGSSLESFEDAVESALRDVPAGPEGLKRGRVVEMTVEQGGFVGRTQYRVKLIARQPAPQTKSE
jgi:flavin-binding protein dodecin